jgi:hypothetical protein
MVVAVYVAVVHQLQQSLPQLLCSYCRSVRLQQGMPLQTGQLQQLAIGWALLTLVPLLCYFSLT